MNISSWSRIPGVRLSGSPEGGSKSAYHRSAYQEPPYSGVKSRPTGKITPGERFTHIWRKSPAGSKTRSVIDSMGVLFDGKLPICARYDRLWFQGHPFRKISRCRLCRNLRYSEEASAWIYETGQAGPGFPQLSMFMSPWGKARINTPGDEKVGGRKRSPSTPKTTEKRSGYRRWPRKGRQGGGQKSGRKTTQGQDTTDCARSGPSRGTSKKGEGK